MSIRVLIMTTGNDILGTHLMDLLAPNAQEIATFGNQGSNALLRLYEANAPVNGGYLMGLSNAKFGIGRASGGTTNVGIGTFNVENGTNLRVEGTMSVSNITTYNPSGIISFAENDIANINDINFSGILYQGSQPFKTSQWTTSTSNIWITSSNVGIGTTLPLADLHVLGNALISGRITVNEIIETMPSTLSYNSYSLLNSVSDSKTIQTNDTSLTNRILFSFTVKQGRYLLSANLPFRNLSTMIPIDTFNWANVTIYRATPATLTANSEPIYTMPINSIRSSSSSYESVPLHCFLSETSVGGDSFVVVVNGSGHLLQFGVGAVGPTPQFYVIPMRGLGIDDNITLRQALQVAAVRGNFTATTSQTTFNVSSLGSYEVTNSDVDVYVNGSKKRITTEFTWVQNYNVGTNATTYTVTLVTPCVNGDKVDVAIWPRATGSNYFASGYLYQSVINVASSWANVVGGGLRAPNRVIVDGDLIVQGNIYGGCNTNDFWSGMTFDSNVLSILSETAVIGTCNILDGSITSAKLRDGAITASKLDFSSGNLGIGTTVATDRLRVEGGIQVTGNIKPTACNVYDLGSANFRFRDLYLSGTTIDLGGIKIQKNDTTGGIQVLSETNQPVDTSTRNLFATGNITASGTITASNLNIIGDFVTLNTVTSNTEQIVVNNAGTGPALKVIQSGANTVAEFYDAEGPTPALFIANGGNVGVGTATPLYKTQIEGDLALSSSTVIGSAGRTLRIGDGCTSSNNAILALIGDSTYSDYGFRLLRRPNGSNANTDLQHRGTGELNIWCLDQGPINLKTDQTERLTVLGTGFVGIGTTTPQTSFHAHGGATGYALFTATASPSLVLGTSSSAASSSNATLGYATSGGHYCTNSANGDIVFRNNLSNKNVHILAGNGEAVMSVGSANVGIGNVTPTEKLDISGSMRLYDIAPNLTLQTSDNLTSDSGSVLFRNVAGAYTWRMGRRYRGVTNNADLTFSAGTDSDYTLLTDVLTMTSATNVGVGTTLPSQKMHVEGNIYATTQFLGQINDTVTNPSFSWSGDTNCGIYHPANDAIGFVTGGTEKMRLINTGSGRLGIGTTNPLALLHVGTGNANGGLLLDGDNATFGYSKTADGASYIDFIGQSNAIVNDARITRASGINGGFAINNKGTGDFTLTTSDAADMVFKTTNSVRMTIASGGNVGVGSAAPAAKFHVSKTDTGDIFRVDDQTAETTPFIINDIGSVGIGTTNPSTFKVHVYGGELTGTRAIGDRVDILRLNGKENNQNCLDIFDRVHTAGVADWTRTGTRIQKIVDSTNFGYIEFNPVGSTGQFAIAFGQTNGGEAEHMRITGAGSVGIGTTNPQVKFHVEGATFTGNSALANGSVAMFVGKFLSANNSGFVNFTHNGTDGSAANTLTMGVFGAGVGNYLYISGTGNVGIGLTNPSQKLDVNGSMCLSDPSNSKMFLGNTTTGDARLNVRDFASNLISFYANITKVGSITTNATTTTYNTSSDYRLKENVVPLTNSLIKLNLLKPKVFNFISDPTIVYEGFLAHEVQEVVSYAIHGQKDAVDDEGNPSYQGIDHSMLVPILTGAVQELSGIINAANVKITTLESEIAAIKAHLNI